MKKKQIDKAYNDYRNPYALELFGKESDQLSWGEGFRLDEYIKDIQNPEWRKVDTGVGPILEVNQLGTGVRDYETKKDYIIYYPGSDDKNNFWYPIIGIKDKDGKQRPQSVHQLVALAFVENPDPEHKTQVNHIDGNKRNNWYHNLEWVTASENHQHAVRTGLQPHGEDHPMAKVTTEQVEHTCELLRYHPDWTFEKIGNITGLTNIEVREIYNGITWKHISKDYMPFPPRQTQTKGEAVYNAKMTEKEVDNICYVLDDVFDAKQKLTYDEIAEMFNTTNAIITDIATGRTWMHVSSKHPFYEKIGVKRDKYKETYSENQIRKVCELLINPKTTFIEIEKATGVNQATVGCVYRHESYTDISKNYIFPERKTRAPGEMNGKATSTAEQIEEVCKLLDEGKLYVKDIATKTGVNQNIVFKVSNGKTWTEISKNHPFYKKKFG